MNEWDWNFLYVTAGCCCSSVLWNLLSIFLEFWEKWSWISVWGRIWVWRAWKCKVESKEKSETRSPGCQIIVFSFAKSTFSLWCFKMVPVQVVHQNRKLAKLNVEHLSDLRAAVNLPFFCAGKWPHSSWPVTCSSLRSSSSSCTMSGWHSAKKTSPVLTYSLLVCMPERCCPGVPLALINPGLSRWK